MVGASEGHHSVSENRENLHQRVANVRLACIGLEIGSGLYGGGNADGWLLVSSVPIGLESRKRGGWSSKDIDAREFGEIGGECLSGTCEREGRLVAGSDHPLS
jgi:hypothetical protein